MKKIILPILIVLTVAFFLPSQTNAQSDCHEIFNKESNNCLKENTICINECADKARAAMSLTVDGGKVNLECQKTVCDSATTACNNKAKANFTACKDAKEAKENSTKKVVKKTPLLDELGINPYELWLKNKDLFEFSEIVGNEGVDLESGFLNMFGIKSKRQEETEIMQSPIYKALHEAARMRLSEGQIDTSTEDKAWETPAPAGVVKTTDIPTMTDTKRYSWDTNSGAVIKSDDWERIKFREPIEIEGITSHLVELEEGGVEVKVRNEKPSENKFGVDAGWLGVTVSRTHFYVYKNPDGRSAAVIVYEGEVQVKVGGVATVNVKPDGDQPGIMIVEHKLSPVKLVVTGLIIAVVIGGIVWFVKKKSPQKNSKKR